MIVYCIDIINSDLTFDYPYNIIKSEDPYVTIEEFPWNAYNISRFITIQEYRKMKISKIKERM